MSPQEIDWNSQETHVLHNPKLPAKDKDLLSKLRPLLPEISSCIWILTSGSTSTNQYKWIALSKSAFLASGKAVNEHIESNENDIWLNPLPIFHVGGLSIWARAYLSGAKVIETLDAWNPHHFIHTVDSNKITLSSLVPTQLFDLVYSELRCPDSLRAVFVGGGSLSEEIYFKARELGYPVLPTYGMTEACSQIATAGLESLNVHQIPEAEILKHIKVRKDDQNVLEIQGESLMTGIAYIENNELKYIEHSPDDWYSTDDIGDVQGNFLKVRGRKSEIIKVLGELVSIPKLRSVLDLISDGLESTLVSVPDERKGHSLALVLELDALRTGYIDVVNDYNGRVAPFEKATQLYFVDKIPKTPLGKIKTNELKEKLGVV